MEISDENIIDLYIILGVFCGTLLISTLVCIALYCHWHKHHKYKKIPKVYIQSRTEPQSDEKPKNQISPRKLSFKRLFKFKQKDDQNSPIESKRKIQIVHEHLENKNTDGLGQQPDGRLQADVAQTRTGSRHMMNTGSNERNSITGFNEKSGICQTEIDLSSSCIELIVHRNDGTIRRKKYRDHPRPVSCQIPSRENGSLARPTPTRNRPSSEYGYTIDYRKYRSFSESFDGDQESSDPIELELLTKTSSTHETRILSDHNLLATNPDGLKRHFSTPACRSTGPTYGPAYRPSPAPDFEKSPRSAAPPPPPLTIEEPKIGQSDNDLSMHHVSNTSPIDSTASSGYHSNDIDKCVSPPMPTPNEIRTLTRRITEIQNQSSKRFVRYNSLPNYRLNYIPVSISHTL